jgi:uncharacterized protein YbbK (DUF523 family)
MSMKNTRIDKQKNTIKAMIKLYCHKKHNTKEELCYECMKLLDYATMRLDNCKFKDSKPNCGSCKIHCYKKDMREKICKVMQFSGPRMLIYNPKIVTEQINKLKYNSLNL